MTFSGLFQDDTRAISQLLKDYIRGWTQINPNRLTLTHIDARKGM